MRPKQLFALPIQEGVVLIRNECHVVWRDYRWNTGEVVRRWFIDCAKFRNAQIRIEPIKVSSWASADQ